MDRLTEAYTEELRALMDLWLQVQGKEPTVESLEMASRIHFLCDYLDAVSKDR